MDNHGFTQTPNYIYDLIPLIKPSEYVILSIIIRHTVGWHKEYDRISFSQFEKESGLHRETISKSLHSLQERKLILVSSDYQYCVNWDEIMWITNWSEKPTAVGKTDQQRSEKPTTLVGKTDQ